MRLVRDSELSATAKTLCYTLALRFNGKDPASGAYPSQERLAREMSFTSPRTVRKGVKEAREAGLLETEKVGPRKVVYRPICPAKLQEEPQEPTPDPFGEAAQLIREHWWLAKNPPEPGWTMGKERTIWRGFAKAHGAEVVNAAIPLARAHFDMNGEPFTGKLVNSQKTRARWNDCLSRAVLSLVESEDHERTEGSGGTVGELLEGVAP